MNLRKLAAAALLLGGVALVLSFRPAPSDPGADVVVYKSPTCGCCSLWVDHLEEAGFTVRAENVMDMAAVKYREGVPMDLSSCHTAIIGDYVFEGHIPAGVIRDFLDEAPDLAGLAVPGMPIGSPGMEGPNPTAYDVIAFDRDGNRGVFERIEP
ncbi:MAG: DUF411 domain-containing protein [Gemmatimonadetes bacterium]|nr:DUF411 domain-containing protein [Gemmatimonadota bacterium]MXX72895.1 DUF411 domain-containing protein [Gemmatimonadota bacterium]MYC90373.1 DUF411 domain-containing protein [Gemmatimonadota bacterium]MYG36189.1 DUF411 domain-containing protein [Gemmatimonadota bacterium]MYJ18335.1 DUF411 domain-containing protein [Gemmatimonadota bacterium]